MKRNLNLLKHLKRLKQESLRRVKGRDFHVKPELDLRGERYENALIES